MVHCVHQREVNDREYFKLFREKAAKQRIPLSGSIELTHRCNLHCIHCYVGQIKNGHVMGSNELKTTQILSILDEITEAGCLHLLFTGGEPLLRRDFPAVFRHAKRNGLLVTIFTNGTLITDNIAGLFREFPPLTVEISLYGATDTTYEKITGVRGSYKRCLNGIEQLLENKVNVKLKTILMTPNSHEFSAIERIAQDYGVKFRFDPAIFPTLSGDQTPLKHRVAPHEAVEKEFSDTYRAKQWIEHHENFNDIQIPDTLYNCGAGLTNFHIDRFGNLQPCLMVTGLKYDLVSGNFANGWNDVIYRIRERRITQDHACYKCEKRTVCGFCPAFFGLETGSEVLPSEYLCEMGKIRFQKINNCL